MTAKKKLRILVRSYSDWVRACLGNNGPHPDEERQLVQAALAVSDEDIRTVEELGRAAFEAMREQGLKLTRQEGEEGKDE